MGGMGDGRWQMADGNCELGGRGRRENDRAAGMLLLVSLTLAGLYVHRACKCYALCGILSEWAQTKTKKQKAGKVNYVYARVVQYIRTLLLTHHTFNICSIYTPRLLCANLYHTR